MILVENINLEDGTYKGIWGGYTLTINDKEYKTKIGIKCIGHPVTIKIRDKIAYSLNHE